MKIFFTFNILIFVAVAQGAEYKIIQLNKSFDIKEMSINVGDTIVFKNDEKDITHNVYSLGPENGFELKIQQPGESSSVVFKKEGKTEVECAIHPGMKLNVTVKAKSKQ